PGEEKRGQTPSGVFAVHGSIEAWSSARSAIYSSTSSSSCHDRSPTATTRTARRESAPGAKRRTSPPGRRRSGRGLASAGGGRLRPVADRPEWDRRLARRPGREPDDGV